MPGSRSELVGRKEEEEAVPIQKTAAVLALPAVRPVPARSTTWSERRESEQLREKGWWSRPGRRKKPSAATA